MLPISKKLLSPSQRKSRPSLSDDIPFGRIPTDHMLVSDYLSQKGGWQAPEILPYGHFSFSPSAIVFHYGQQIFEGLKAYRSPQNTQEVFLFRPDKNAERFYNSAERLGMQPFPQDLFVECVKQITAVDADWVLPQPGALYIRPTLIPLDEGVSYRASQDYRFFITLSPAKNYYSKEVSIPVYIERSQVRAFPGGTGEAKCGGNYAAALQGLAKAKAVGAEQVLWLDGVHHKYVEEVGAMNMMFVYADRIVTPPLNGTILPGVTRSSLIELGRHLGYRVEETPVEIDSILADAQQGRLVEAFGCGTAAVVTLIDTFIDGDRKITLPKESIGQVSLKLKKALLDIQTGQAPDSFGWRHSLANVKI